MKNKKKLVLLGSGGFGKKILKILNNFEKYDIECYNSNILFKDISLNNIDWVFIATPNEFHYEQALFFIKNGINVFLEKPGTLSYNSLKDLIDLSNEKK